MSVNSVTTGSAKDPVCDQFVEELHDAADRAAVLNDYVARHPQLAQEFRELAAMVEVMKNSEPPPPLPGVLEGRLGEFQIVRKLEVGGMGEIYEARQDRLNRSVALKIIRRGRVTAEGRSRFLREQQVLARLHQTHIVPIHTASEEGSLQYFVMPFIRGVALRKVIQALRQASCIRTPAVADLVGRELAQTPSPSTAKAQATDTWTKPIEAQQMPRLGHDWNRARQTLSLNYFRSVAQVIGDAAEALHHAHQAGVLHRDVKPDNIMVEPSGHCWLIDFGLAGFQQSSAAPGKPATMESADEQSLSGSGGLHGTVPYMAPEQFDGHADSRTDVWGLGVTLYELLTLERAFRGSVPEVQQQILDSPKPPDPARGPVRDVPADLAAICRKAMHKQPDRRYATALAMAEDLRRWLRGEPIWARPARAGRRMYLWARRNKGWALAIACALFAFTTLAVAAIVLAKTETMAANEREQEQLRQVLLQKLQLQRLRRVAESDGGWSAKSWDLVRRAAAIRRDDELRNQAAAILIGLDARRRQEFRDLDASAVLFDRGGKRLLIGGADASPGRGVHKARPATPARMLDLSTGDYILAKALGPGPVAFQTDGTPLHVLVDATDHLKIRIRDFERPEDVQRFRIPGDEKAVPLSASNHPVVAITEDGLLLAATVRLADAKGKSILVVWEVKTGKVLRQVSGIQKELTALTLNGEAGLVAAGNEQGEIIGWSLHKGDGAPEFALSALGRSDISCLAVHRGMQRRGGDPHKQEPRWLLAAGDRGGGLTIWDLEQRIPTAFCHGSLHAVHTVAFSPDGTTLASAGRGPAKLWDIATGQLVLTVPSAGDFSTGLAFSPDGKQLAYSSRSVFGGEGGAGICDLEYGRGVLSLRGLAGPVHRVHFSKGSKYLAALSDAWQVGIWDVQSGFLLHLLDVPPGFATDNAALAFSPDHQRFAFASGTKSQLWDINRGQLLASYDLPPGLHDALAFDADGKRLMLCRWERQDGKVGDVLQDFSKGPRVCRVRDLLAPDVGKKNSPSIPVNEQVHYILTAPDASYFVLVTGDDGKAAQFHIYEGFSAKTLRPPIRAGVSYLLDPTGQFLAIPTEGGGSALLGMPSGELLETWKNHAGNCLSPRARFWGSETGTGYGFMLGRGGDSRPLVTLAVDSPISIGQFSDDGQLLALGTADGTVIVCDHREVQRRLAEVGFGWE